MNVSPAPSAAAGSGQDAAPSRRRTYAAVILVEVITLVGLWIFQSYFRR